MLEAWREIAVADGDRVDEDGLPRLQLLQIGVYEELARIEKSEGVEVSLRDAGRAIPV